MVSDYAVLAAGIAIAGGLIGTGMAQSGIGAAGMGIIAEKPEKFGQVIFFFVIPETLWIIGFVLGIILLLGIISGGRPSTMSLERLVEEIRSRGEAELKEVEARLASESQRITEERDRRVQELGVHAERQGQLEANRERAQRVAAAKLRARQKLYEAREARLEHALDETRELLRAYTSTPQYPQLLDRMYRAAQAELGRDSRGPRPDSRMPLSFRRWRPERSRTDPSRSSAG